MQKYILTNAINPALERLAAHRIQPSDAARVMLIAIGLQESALKHRTQVITSGNPGPARGLWQFEAMGGVNGVMTHRSSESAAKAFATEFVGSHNAHAIWVALAYEDVLASVFARLLLWTDPRPLPQPSINEAEAAWQYYIQNWRPGKPHRHTWDAHWVTALNTVFEA